MSAFELHSCGCASPKRSKADTCHANSTAVRAGEAVIGKRSEAVQTAGPIDGDARRTSVSEGNVNEEEALEGYCKYSLSVSKRLCLSRGKYHSVLE